MKLPTLNSFIEKQTKKEQGKPEKNLVVTHNIPSEKIPQIAKTGLFSPSLAIVHKNKPMKGFGDVTLIAHPSKINPKKVPVYDDDAYTPRFGEKFRVVTHHEINEDAWNKLSKELHDHLDGGIKDGDIPIYDNDDPTDREYLIGERHKDLDDKLGRVKKAIEENDPNPSYGSLQGILYRNINQWVTDRVHKQNGLVGYGFIDKEGNPIHDFWKDKLKDIFTGNSKTYVESQENPDQRIELTPENEKAILDRLRGKYKNAKGGIKGGEYATSLHNSEDALNLYLINRLKSYNEIRQAGNSRLGKPSNFTPIPVGTHDYQPERLALKAIKRGLTPSEYITKYGLTGYRGKPVTDEAKKAEVGQKLDEWIAARKRRHSPYFEAKPQKHFKLSDFKVALVPAWNVEHNKQMIDGLRQHGVKIVPYNTSFTGEDERERLIAQVAHAEDLMLSEDDLDFDNLIKAELEEAIEAEELSKGAMARLFPFDPVKEKKKIGASHYRWIEEASPSKRVTLFEESTPEIKARSLQKLMGKTQVRRNPKSGEREFLLHRGHSIDEDRSTDSNYYKPYAGITSWSTDPAIANSFVSRGQEIFERPSKMTSAWIPESKIGLYIPQLGTHYGNEKGPLTSIFQREQEVLVAPGTYEKHTQLNKSEGEATDTPQKCVLTIITDGMGKMLFIKRHDTGAWSVVAGHMEPNETPEEAARREIKEETGLDVDYLTQIHYYNNPDLYCFSAQCQGEPTNRNDPDCEGKPQWIDITRGVPANIYGNLAGPEDDTNIVRQLFDKANLKKSEYNWLEECGFLDLSKAETFEEIQHGQPDSFVGYHWAPDAASANALVQSHSLGKLDDSRGLFVSDEPVSWASPWVKEQKGSLVHGSVDIKNPYVLKGKGIEELGLINKGKLAQIKAAGYDAVVNPGPSKGIGWTRQALLFYPNKQLKQVSLSGPEIEEKANRAKLISMGKSEDELSFEELGKGAMQRLFPFDPAKEVERPAGEYTSKISGKTYPTTVGERIGDWSGGDWYGRENLVNVFSPEMKERSLHRLHGLTQVRRGEDGGREFLLHRGHGQDAAPVSATHYNGETASSWTPDYNIAKRFTNNNVVSAWVPESAVQGYLPLVGRNLKMGLLGNEQVAREKEVIVGPGQFELHKSEEPLEKKDHTLVTEPKESKEKNLLVVHNLSQGNLQHAHELGGLAAPSIAIHRKDHPFASFGDITLVAHPSMVDPEYHVPVFNADAYTPRHPRPNYKINSKYLTKLKKELEPHAEHVREMSNLHSELEDQIKDRGAREAIEHLSIVPILQTAFLHEKGHHVKQQMRKVAIRSPLSKEKPMRDFFLQNGNSSNWEYGSDYHKKLTEAYKQSVDSFAKQTADKDVKKGDIHEWQKHFDMYKSLYGDELNDEGVVNYATVDHFIRDNQNLGKREVDKYSTQEAVAKRLKQLGLEKEYAAWAINKVKPAQLDPYIPMPNRRKLPYTMENILKIVTKKGIKGGEDVGAFKGVGYARSKGAKRFSSLDHIRRNQGQLMNESDFESRKKEMDNRFFALSDKLKKYYTGGSVFHALDSLVDAIGEAYKKGHSLRSELYYSQFKDVPEYLVDELKEYTKDLVNSGTTYFEAKPQRKVDLSEFKGAVVPKNVDPAVLDILRQHGIENIEPYDTNAQNVPTDRLAAVNRVADKQDLKLSEEDLHLPTLKK